MCVCKYIYMLERHGANEVLRTGTRLSSLSIQVHLSIYLYLYLYIERENPRETPHPPGQRGGVEWPLQDIVLLLVVCARVNRPFILPARLHCPHWCNTFARLLGNIRPALDLPLICHTPYNIGTNNIV